LVVIILVLVALLTPFIIIAVLLWVLAIIIGAVAKLAIYAIQCGTSKNSRFVVVSIALLLVRVLVRIVMILAILLVVIIPVLALLALGWSLAVAVIVMTSLRMSGHLGE
jgi:hypothetical protein